MFLWQYIKSANLPVILYGTGNGADKIFSICEQYGIPVASVFASDDHSTNKTFHELPVQTYSEIAATYEQGIILLAFGIYDEHVIQRFLHMSPHFEVYAPDLPLTGGPFITPSWISSNASNISAAKMLLCDKQSHAVFNACLANKLDGQCEPMLSVESERETDLSLLSLGSDEDYLDLGAYTGDTIQEFLNITKGQYCSISAFEPDSHNYKKLEAYTKQYNNVTLYPYAAWNQEMSLTFTGKGGRNVAVLPDVPGRYRHLREVPAIPVDTLYRDFSFIKLDVEGAEAEALTGMREVLNRCHPKLMISVYHKTDDLIRIPLLINSLCPGYKMYLRKNHCLPAWELQLYCIYKQTDILC